MAKKTNPLTAIRNAFTNLHTAYEVVQDDTRKQEALKLIQRAEVSIALAKQAILKGESS